MSERDEAKRAAKAYAEKAMIAHEDHETFPQAERVAIDAFLAGRESLRAERAELGSGWRAYEAEHKRSLKLIEALRSIAGENLPTEALYKYEKISRKAIAEYEANR